MYSRIKEPEVWDDEDIKSFSDYCKDSDPEFISRAEGRDECD